MEIKIVDGEVYEYIKKHRLETKWKKVLSIFPSNPRYPSLHTEILEPKHRGIFSLRIDHKFRALFVVKNGFCLVFKITNHYKR